MLLLADMLASLQASKVPQGGAGDHKRHLISVYASTAGGDGASCGSPSFAGLFPPTDADGEEL